MPKEHGKTVGSQLESAGFRKEGRQNWTLWRLSSSELQKLNAQAFQASIKGGKPSRLRDPWRLSKLEIGERKGTFSPHVLEFFLDKSTVLSNLSRLTRKHFGARTTSEYLVRPCGLFWCLFRFHRPRSRGKTKGDSRATATTSSPYGVAGFSFRFRVDGSKCHILVSDHFGMGYLPPNFASAPMRFIGDALGLSRKSSDKLQVRFTSVFESEFDLVLPVFSKLTAHQQKERMPWLDAMAASRDPVQGDVTDQNEAVRFTLSGLSDDGSLVVHRQSSVPWEVLESRERAGRYGDIDQLIAEGRYQKALLRISECLNLDPDSLYLIRRLCLLDLVGYRDRTIPRVTEDLEREPTNKLFLSFRVSLALDEGHQNHVLKHLSRLGAKLSEDLGNLDELETFDVIFPEMLGDAWCSEDRRKAEECYRRITQKQGDLARIVRKLIDLSRADGDMNKEMIYLERLAKVERRRVELAKIHYRQATIKSFLSTGRGDAIALALKSLKFDKGHYHSALLAGELLIEDGRPEEAIELLDGLLKDPSLGLPPRAKSQLEAKIGDIWYVQVKRPDLAETRYEQAIKHDGENIDVLEKLEQIYRSEGRMEGLPFLLESQFGVHEKRGDVESLKKVFDELVGLYRNVLGQPKQAVECYFRLLGSVHVEPEEIESILTWRDVDVDWQDLYEKLCDKLSTLESSRKKCQYLCRLSEVARNKLGHHEAAIHHLQMALGEGWVDGPGFSYLVEKLAAAGDYAALARCYEMRIEQVPVKAQKPLLMELLTLPGVISEAHRDALAIRTYLIDGDDDRPIYDRLRYYQTMDDVGGIDRILDMLEEEPAVSSFQRTKWLRYANEILLDCQDSERYLLLDRNYRRLLESSEEDVEVLQEAIETLRGSMASTRLPFYIVRLLGRGILPVLEEDEIRDLLAGLPGDLATYHKLMSFKMTRPDDAAHHARTAAALYATRTDEHINMENMIARMCTMVPCAQADLDDLKRLVDKSGHWSLYGEALEKQADFEDDGVRKYELLMELGDIFRYRRNDYSRARSTYVLAMNLSPTPHRIKLILAEAAREAREEDHEKKALLVYLQDENSLSDLSEVRNAVARLIELGDYEETILKLFQPRIDAALGEFDHELTMNLCDVLLQNGIRSMELFQTAFRAAVAADRREYAVELWWRGLACSRSRSKVRSYIAETRGLLLNEKQMDVLVDCFNAALANRVGDRLGSTVNHEILVHYGALLFELDGKRRKALSVYKEAYLADQSDNRTWIPLYFLLLEFGTPEQLLRHLRQVVPKLIKDPRPFKSFPTTIESLQRELRELERQCLEYDGERVEDENEEALAEPSGATMPLEAAAGAEDLPVRRAISPSTDTSGDLPSMLPPVPEHKDMPLLAQTSMVPPPPFHHPTTPSVSSQSHHHELEPLSLTLDLDDSMSGSDHGIDGASSERPVFSLKLDSSQSGTAQGGDFENNGALGLEGETLLPKIEWTGSAGTSATPVLDLSDEQGSGASASAAKMDPWDRGMPVPPPDLVAHSMVGQPIFSLDAAVDEGIDVRNISSVELAAAIDLSSEVDLSAASESPEEGGCDDEKADMNQKERSGDDGVAVERERESEEASEAHGSEPVVRDGPLQPGQDEEFDDAPTSVVSSPMDAEHPTPQDMGGFGLERDPPNVVTDWRAAVINCDFSADMTERLLVQAFASELEKHIAIQAVALVAGNCDELGSWHWRVWRHSKEYGYPLSGRERYPSGFSSDKLHTSLHKLLITVAPLMVRIYRHKFTLEALARRLNIKMERIAKIRKPLSWTEGTLSDVGFHLYHERIGKKEYRVFHLPDLRGEIFYDGKRRTIYLDVDHYKEKPPSHLFHRVLSLLWSVRLHYFVPLTLHPQRHIMPFLQNLNQTLGAQGLSKIKTALGTKNSLQRALAKTDTRQLRALYEKVGMPKEDAVVALWHTMRAHIYRLILSETLDIVGTFEAILGKDLLVPGALKHSQIYNSTPYAKELMRFVTKLKI